MQKLIFFVAIIFPASFFGQTTVRGRVLTIIDNHPVSNFGMQVGKKQIIRTDSTGSFSISTKKRKIKLSFPHAMTQSKDTTIFIPGSSKKIITLYTSISWDSSQAKYDIQNNTMRLFCCPGFLVPAPTQREKEFEKEFGVKYFIVGDASPAPIDKLRTYNIVIMQYLDKNYGGEWRKKAKQFRL